jgi:hypothetical protein
MKAAAPLTLREAGQNLWLDNITRHLLTSGTLTRYIAALATDLQRKGAKSCINSWNELMTGIVSKSEVLRKAG